MLILIWFGVKTVLMYLSLKLYVDLAKYGIKELKKLPNISLPLDFVNGPPSLMGPLSIKPLPSGGSRIG